MLHVSFCCLPISCPSLSLSIRFPDDAYSTFQFHVISRKGFWGSLWSRSFPIFKSLRDQICPFQSILVHWLIDADVHSCHLLFDHFQFILIHGLYIPGSYAILFFIASDFTSITCHIHNRALFSLWLHLFILSEVTSPVFSNSILGTYRPGEFIFQCPIFLLFHTVYWVLKASVLKWFAIPFSSGPHFVRTFHHDSPVLGDPTWHGS